MNKIFFSQNESSVILEEVTITFPNIDSLMIIAKSSSVIRSDLTISLDLSGTNKNTGVLVRGICTINMTAGQTNYYGNPNWVGVVPRHVNNVKINYASVTPDRDSFCIYTLKYLEE